MIELQKAKDWSDLLLKLITIIAIPVGGWWAYYNFSITDTAETSPAISVSAEVAPYDAHSSLLVTHIKPKNIGKIPISLAGGKSGGDISIKIRVLPPGLELGRVDESKLPTQALLDSLVAEYENDYTIEPGVEYDDVRSFIVPRGKTYFVHAELTLPNEGGVPADEESVDSSAVVEVK